MRVSSNLVHRMLFPTLTYATKSPDIHLTFDDGPHPVSTNIVLDILKKRNAKATFFVVGKNVHSNPEITRRIVNEGHSIGNHTFDHPLFFLRSRRLIKDQIMRTDDVIAEVTSKRTRLFRPPYGFLDPWAAKIVKQLGYETIMWTTDPADFQTTPLDKIVDRATSHPSPGSIILLHDNDSTSKKVGDILPRILDRLEQRGFSLSPIPS